MGFTGGGTDIVAGNDNDCIGACTAGLTVPEVVKKISSHFMKT
jgi:hypothetical protein